ncbi:MAG: hypothetical protein O3A85_07030 [Proteobacteria bacterium]|nr:hypothetical protein [Pseudomonadota bacterium]
MITTRCRPALPLLAFALVLTADMMIGATDAAMPPALFEVGTGTLVKNQPPRPPDAPPGYNWWHYQVTLRETSGRAGVTLTGWTKCYVTKDDTGCENVRANFDTLYGTARVPAGGTVRLIRPAWVWADKTGNTYKVEANYWGVDDNGHKVESGYKFKMTSD